MLFFADNQRARFADKNMFAMQIENVRFIFVPGKMSEIQGFA